MAPWLKVLLTALTGFSTGAAAVSTADPHANTPVVLLVGGANALSMIGSLFIKRPQDNSK